jgi:predicted lysophospholipase L1 biosynthesis ABC-type transport system permease subunit
MRWGIFCSALAVATMIATAGVADTRMQSAGAEQTWESLAGPLPVTVARPVRATEVRARVAGSALAVGLTSGFAALSAPHVKCEAGFTGPALELSGRGLCQAQTSRGPPVA